MGRGEVTAGEKEGGRKSISGLGSHIAVIDMFDNWPRKLDIRW